MKRPCFPKAAAGPTSNGGWAKTFHLRRLNASAMAGLGWGSTNNLSLNMGGVGDLGWGPIDFCLQKAEQKAAVFWGFEFCQGDFDSFSKDLQRLETLSEKEASTLLHKAPARMADLRVNSFTFVPEDCDTPVNSSWTLNINIIFFQRTPAPNWQFVAFSLFRFFRGHCWQ